MINFFSKIIPNGFSERKYSGEFPVINKNTLFPMPYRNFIEYYGTGILSDFIIIFNPFEENDDLNFFIQKELILGDFKYLIEDCPDDYDFSLYPDEGGLLPFGVTENGDYLFWVTSFLDSSEWEVAVIPARSNKVEKTGLNFFDFLEKTLTGKVKISSFPNDFYSSIPVFREI